MYSFLPILFVLMAGIFFLIGYYFVYFIKDKQKLTIISTSMALIVMLGLIIFDIIPEMLEIIEEIDLNLKLKYSFLFLIPIMGMLFLKIFDKVLPSHHHEHHEKEKNIKEHYEHSRHIGVITACSLILHNIIEGMSIYIIGIENLSGAFLMSLAVGLHNLPLGIEIFTSLENRKKIFTNKLFLLLLIFSGMIGSIIIYLFKNYITQFTILILIGISLGMIIYIVLFELLAEVMNYKKEKETFYGVIIGIIILIFMLLIN